jgi:hypothetical protein
MKLAAGTHAADVQGTDRSPATIETLAELKNPRQVAFVNQANLAGGHQQVNNGALESNPGNERSIIDTKPLGEKCVGNC